MRRRRLLTAIGAGPLALAGCTDLPASAGGEELPDACPTSQDLDVEWPRDLNETTAAAFIAAYEEAYYRREVFDDVYEPRSRLDAYGGWIAEATNVTDTDDGGWRVAFEGVVGVERVGLYLDLTAVEPPETAEVIPGGAIDDERLGSALEEAAETGRATRELGVDRTDDYLDRFEALTDGFALTGADDSETLYVDVDGTTVELVVEGYAYHADHFWYVTYSVDQHVVWRSAAEATDPREGDLLECRTDS